MYIIVNKVYITALLDSKGYLTLSDRPKIGALVNAIKEHN